MLEENDYESWKIRIERYIKGKTHGKLIWKSIINGPSPHQQITDPVLDKSQLGTIMKSRTNQKRVRCWQILSKCKWIFKLQHSESRIFPGESSNTLIKMKLLKNMGSLGIIMKGAGQTIGSSKGRSFLIS
ncbi:hypothetical protein Tco_1419771 [Tanacetum coccineum]